MALTFVGGTADGGNSLYSIGSYEETWTGDLFSMFYYPDTPRGISWHWIYYSHEISLQYMVLESYLIFKALSVSDASSIGFLVTVM